MSWPPTGQCVPVFQSNTRIVGNESGRDWIKQGNVYIFVMHVDCKRCWRGGDGWRWRVRHLGQINCYFFWFGSRQSRVVVGFEQILVAFIFFFISAFLPPSRPAMNYFRTKRIPLVFGLVVARWCIYRMSIGVFFFFFFFLIFNRTAKTTVSIYRLDSTCEIAKIGSYKWIY